MRRMTLFLLFVLSVVSLPLPADQAPFGPVQGQVREVIIERQVEGDPVPFHVAIDTRVGFRDHPHPL